jgi:hypothetical protein
MGRKIAIAMELEDEEAFLAFLRTSADVSVYRSWSPEPKAISGFVPDTAASPFYLHNLAFSWEPEFELVQYEDRFTGQQNHYYRLVTRHAPIVEYSRHPLAAAHPQVSGRLYWAKLFVSQYHQVQYDLPLLDAWFSSVARWVRKHGQKVRHGSTEPWCLPLAQRRLQNGL